jgi:hypothetical protein
MSEGRTAADVRGVWKRFAGAGKWSTWELRAARSTVLRAKVRSKEEEEGMVACDSTNDKDSNL